MSDHKRVRVLIETSERAFKGFVYKPIKDDRYRLSDHLNDYNKQFICLSEVEVSDRGQHYRVGDRLPFIAIAINAITYITPLEPDE